MKSKGILFYVNFANPLPLLPVALRSLSIYYTGAIHVLYGENVPNWFIKQLEKCPRITNSFHKKKVVKIGRKRWRVSILEKPYMYKSSPFDLTLFYDCDHLFLQEMDTSIFDMIEEHKLVNPVERPDCPIGKQSNILKIAHGLYGRDPNLMLGEAMGGCVGILKDSDVHEELIRVQEDILAYPGRHMLSDEHALSLMVEKYGKSLDPKWSWAYKQKKHAARRDRGLQGMPDNIIGLHFAHKRYAISRIWRDALLKAKDENVLGLEGLWDQYIESNTHVRDVLAMDEKKIKS